MSKHNLADALRYAGFTTAYDNILDPSSEPWRGHIAFARVLMAEFRPDLFVELGTYYGVSFFAVCQAVKEEGLATRCCAIDSWEGDEQAGFYENAVYEKVKAIASTQYPHTATLIRSLFDDALPQFENESIDVLHIDGLHTYEAVRHDFDTWLPKVKPGGIILFHDVNEYRETFGAYRVWNEIALLSEESYLFRHSHGLGVWRKPGGKPLETPLLSALLGKDRSDATMVDTYITALADKEIYRIIAQQRADALEQKQLDLDEHVKVINVLRNDVSRNKDEVYATLNVVHTLRDELGAARMEADRVTNEYTTVRKELAATKRALETTKRALETTQSTLDTLVNSRSWKLTSPLRVSGRLARGLLRPGSQCGLFAKLVRGLCALPASVVLYPGWSEWKQALRGGSSFFTAIETQAPRVVELARKHSLPVRVAITVPLKFGLKVRQFGGVFPALTRGIKKIGKMLIRCDFSPLPGAATPRYSAHLEDAWRFKPGTEQTVTTDCGALLPGLRLAALPPVLPETDAMDVVDIIIPVYNGRGHLENLLPSLFANTSAPHRFVFIDDKSPDAAIWPWLQEQTAGRDDCLLLQNEENLGFPATVNRGAALSQRNFVILNTDTVVPSGWLERLTAPLLTDPSVASATPFSNAATIFSFPVPNDDTGNTRFLDAVGLEALNAALNGLATPNIPLEAPTGVGFCMAVSRKAWDGHFGFDAQRFGKGYGEEVDWCRRSLRSGWKHVLVPTLYVAHVHGGSFTPEAKAARLICAEETINTLHPEYTTSVARHIHDNPWMPIRMAALLRLCADPARKPALYLGHCRGGGASMYLDRRVAAETASGNAGLILIYDALLRMYTLTVAVAEHRFTCTINSFFDLQEADLHFLTAIRVNNLVGWPLQCEGRSLLDGIAALAEKNEIPLEILFHDFYAVCPRITLLTPQFRFCGLPTDMPACTRCANTDGDLTVDMPQWRQNWQAFLDRCTTLTFFSANTRELVSQVYTLAADRCQVVPHAPLHTFDEPCAVPADGPMCVALAGGIGRHKGSLVVEELADLLQKSHPDVRIVVIGEFDGKVRPNMAVTGPYDVACLPAILAHHKATVALFPSVCPETFSYVIQELCQLAMPVVCFDIGAPAERVRDYPHGLVVREVSASAALAALLELDSRRTTTS